jgi:hypothetical protein
VSSAWIGGLVLFTVVSLAAAEPDSDPDALAVELESSEEVKLTPDEMRTEGKEMMASINAADEEAEQMVEEAKDDKDVVKILCLTDKSGQVDVAATTADERHEAMNVALDRGRIARGRHEFTLLGVLKERVDELMSEANQCIGEETGIAGESELELQVDESLPDTNAEEILPVNALVFEDPFINSNVAPVGPPL